MSPRHPSADPRLVRAALAYAETHTCNATAVHFGINHHTVKRWKAYRAERSPQWPTDQDIAAWEANTEYRMKLRQQRRRHELRRIRNGGNPVLVPPHGTIRRLQALCALGWTQSEIGRRIGVTRARVSDLIRNTRQGVRPETATIIAQLYSELSMIVPVGARSGMVRAYSKNKGWAPPLAWDDETIDDPTARPAGVGVNRPRPQTDMDPAAVLRKMLRDDAAKLTLTQAERVEVCRRLRAEGWSDGRIEEHTGLKVDRYLPKQTAVAA